MLQKSNSFREHFFCSFSKKWSQSVSNFTVDILNFMFGVFNGYYIHAPLVYTCELKLVRINFKTHDILLYLLLISFKMPNCAVL